MLCSNAQHHTVYHGNMFVMGNGIVLREQMKVNMPSVVQILTVFRCINAKILNIKCVPLATLCDNQKDCPYGDDEIACQFQSQFCPQQCYCLMYAISCNRYDGVTFVQLLKNNFISIHISKSNTRFFPSRHLASKLLQVLQLPNNNIRDGCFVNNLKNLLLLCFSNNLISVLQKFCFSSMLLLKSLNLRRNNIFFLKSEAFYNLQSLFFLDISSNSVSKMMPHCFASLYTLKVLYIRNISTRQVSVHVFLNSYVQIIVSNSYHIFCVKPSITLSASPNYWHLCINILSKTWMKIFYYIISAFVITFNLVNIIIQIWKSYDKDNSKYVTIATSFSDLLCGIYLCIMWIADIVHQQSNSSTELWRFHYMCFTAFGIILWNSILGQLLFVFASTIKFLLVFKPFESKIKRFEFTISWIFTIYGLTFSFSLFLTLLVKFTLTTLPTTLCLPFFDPTHSFLVIKIITWFIVISQTCSATIISVMFWLLYIKLKKSTENLGMKRSDRSNKLFVHLLFTALSSVICWFSTNANYILAMFLPQYPYTLIVLALVLAMPLKSLLIPAISLTMLAKEFLIHAGVIKCG